MATNNYLKVSGHSYFFLDDTDELSVARAVQLAQDARRPRSKGVDGKIIMDRVVAFREAPLLKGRIDDTVMLPPDKWL